jgi:hypothetical protein
VVEPTPLSTNGRHHVKPAKQAEDLVFARAREQQRSSPPSVGEQWLSQTRLHLRRMALTPDEAAPSLGCSRDFFDKHIGLSCAGFGADA